MFEKKIKKYFVVNGPYQIKPGQQVEIDKKQAKRRQFLTKHIKGNIYECVKPFQFKAGEIFGFNGEINKKFANVIIDPEEKEEKAADSEEPVKKDNSKLLEKLNSMSKGQLKYYARINCDGMKLTKEQDEGKMIGEIIAFMELEEEQEETKNPPKG